ncbi:Filament-forming protein [Coemansia thaxteri]|uniref:Filament-forming protein n=1 Tax=Coemansia thaxteri TaxID=2663907 RepID=A0A9W8BIN7_9FUNG|nr:Filament-forming protein [Coemansia thaxteri]KAJ2479105.1 Filament-forming protein [Coemansia sp. RSA 2320]
MLPVPTEDALAQLQSDYDLYKSETRKTRVLLEHDASKLQAEVSELRVRAAKAEAQGQFDADRIAMFVSDLAARQKEIEHLRLATSRLHSQVESYERQLDSQGQEAAAERAELSRLRRQTTLLEAERDNLRQNEQRWRSEEQRLVAERSSMTLILENTTKMRDEWQRASEDQVVQVRERLDATRRDADSVRQELKQARDSAERAQFMFETELRELRGQVQLREDRVSQLQAQVAVAQELNTKAQAERRDIEAVRDALQRQVATLEGRIQSQEELMLRAKGQGHTVSKESLLAVQLQDARSQLEALQSELETTATRAEDYRQLSSSNDASLKQLSETYDQYKAEQERVIAEQRAKISRLEAGLSDSTEALTRCREELDSATRTSQEVQAKLNETQSASASRVAQLESEVEHKTAALDALREDMRRHEGVAQNMQEQYEREIVAHAKDIEGTLLAREKLRESQKQLSAATSELLDSQQAAALLQAEVDQTAVRAAAEVQAAESQLSRIKRQNALLLAHLESIGHRVPDITIDPEQIASSIVPQHDGSDGATTVSSASSEANSVGGLREVIVYLRRERDLVSAQLDLAQQESQRWRQQSSHTQRALDEVRKELQQYVPPASSTDGSPSDASSLGQKQADRSPADIIPPGEGPIGLTALQRQACRQQIEQTVLLRESNSVLRSELTSARVRLRELELELSKVKDQEVPQLRSTNATLEAELGATRAQIDQLQAMCDHWKQRHEKVLAKYEMIEPEEHEAIKAENSRLKSESEALHMESTSLRQANAGLQQDVAKLQEQIKHAAEQKTAVFTGRIRSLQQDVSRLQAQIEAQLAELDSEREKASSHEAGARQLREQLDHAQAEAQTAEAGAQGSKAKYEKLHNAFQKLRQQSVEKLDQSNKAIKAHEATIQSLSEQVDTLSAQVESLRAAGIKSAAVPAAPETAERAENLQRVTAEIAELTSEKDQAVEAHLKLAQELQQTQGLLHEARAQLLTQAGQQTQESTFDQAAVPTDASVAEVEQLRARLAEADAKVKDYEGQLEQLKARALKYARDNKVLQSRATDLERQLAELKSQNGGSDADLQKQLDEAKRQLSEAEAKIEQAQTNAKKTAELRSKLQISRANKRADDLEKQVALLQAKLGPLESSGGSLDQPAPADETGSLKRPSDASDTPAKKAHTDDA